MDTRWNRFKQVIKKEWDVYNTLFGIYLLVVGYIVGTKGHKLSGLGWVGLIVVTFVILLSVSCKHHDE